MNMFFIVSRNTPLLFSFVSAIMYTMLTGDLRFALEEHAQHCLCKTADYMNLYFKVKWLYVTYCKNLTQLEGER